METLPWNNTQRYFRMFFQAFRPACGCEMDERIKENGGRERVKGGRMALVWHRWCLLLGRRAGPLAARAGVLWRSDGCALTAARPLVWQLVLRGDGGEGHVRIKVPREWFRS